MGYNPDRISFAGTVLTGSHAGDYKIADSPHLRLLAQRTVSRKPLSIGFGEFAVDVDCESFRFYELSYVSSPLNLRRDWGFWVPEGHDWTDTEVIDTLISGYRRP